MTTSNTAVESAADKAKASEKLAEKRKALGRGLESLLPGPRVVATPASSQFPVRGSQSSDIGGVDGRAGTPVAPSAASETLPSLQAVALGQTADGEQVFRLDLELIDDNPHQTRREFHRDALQELAESIKTQGVLQPIVVRPATGPDKEGRFVLILGERRWRASRLAGLTTIPVIVRRVSEQQAAEMTLVENLQRADLNCVEQAEAFSNLSKQFLLTQEQIGQRVGLSREQVSNYLRLLSLPAGVIGALQKGILQYSHARTLLRLKDHVQIWTLAQKVMTEKLSVAKLEELVTGMTVPGAIDPAKKADGRARWVDPNVKAAQRSIETILGMKVRIRDRNGRGKILIEYATLEDFDRVVTMLKGKISG